MIDAELHRALEHVNRLVAARAGSAPTFLALSEKYMAAHVGTPSYEAYTYRLKPLLLHFGNVPGNAIEQEAVDEYLAKRTAGELGRKVGMFTAQMEIRLVLWILNFATDRKWISHNPLARMKLKKVENAKQAALREEHLQAVVDAAGTLLCAVFVVVAMDTGARRAELLSMRWDDIDWNELTITVRKGKGGKSRVVVSSRRALECVRALPRKLGNPYVFASPSDDRKNLPISKVSINKLVRRAVERSGIERHYAGRKVRIHACRRGHATNAVEKGVDLRSVQEQLGHASIRTTESYVDSRFDHRKREMRKMETGMSIEVLGPRKPPRHSHVAQETQCPERKIVDSR